MLKNVYLFMGEEKYLLDQEVSRWKTNFVKKFGQDSLFVYNSENRDEMPVNQSIFGGGLFSSKKLTIIYGLPLDNAKGNTFRVADVEGFIENFMKKEGKIPEDNLLVFVSNKPDKRSRFFKFLKANANIKEFKMLKDSELKIFVQKQLGDLKITNEALDLFLYKVGTRLYRIESELNKIIYYCQANDIKEIDQSIVSKVVFGVVDVEVFEFLKFMFKSKVRAILYLKSMQDQGLNWNAFSGALYWGLKLYITLYHFGMKGIRDTKLIAKETGINPYALRQNIGYMDLIMKNGVELENMYKELIELEVDIKTGRKVEELFWLTTKKMLNKLKI